VKKTLVNVKIRTGRKTRELLQLSVIFLVLGGLLGAMCGVQYWFCQKDHPGRSFVNCLRKTSK